MPKIYKFKLQSYSADTDEILVPKGSTFLSIECVDGEPVAYFEVPDNWNGIGEQLFKYGSVWTGNQFNFHPYFKYEKSLQLSGLVYHYYVRHEPTRGSV